MSKRFIDEQQMLEDAFRLGVEIFNSDFRPTFIVGLWRGGSAIGIYVQECLQTLGVKTDHIALRTSYRGPESYQHLLDDPEKIRVHGAQYLLENLNCDDRLLIVDDVMSSGLNVKAVIDQLERNLKRNMPNDVRVATLYQKPNARKVEIQPDYCLHSTEDWLVFPYEIQGLSEAEIAEHKAFLTPILNRAK